MDEIVCPHASLRKSKYIVEGRVVLACNNCNPRELVDAAVTTPVVPAYEFAPEHRTYEVPEAVPAFVPYSGEILLGPAKILVDKAKAINDDIKKILGEMPRTPEDADEIAKFESIMDRPGFEATYPMFVTDIEKAQRVLDISTERLRTAMLKANGVEGLTWDQIAKITGKKSGQAAYQYATFKSTKKAKES